MAAAGTRVRRAGVSGLAFDFEGFGHSRPGAGTDARLDTDVVAAAQDLRRHGADRIVLIVNRGHGLTMLAYPDEGPRVLAAVRSFIGDQARR
jgi:hypothetical protein